MLEEIEILEDDEEPEEITHAKCFFRERIIREPLCGTDEYDYLLGFADDDEVTCPKCREILDGDHSNGWVPPAGYA